MRESVCGRKEEEIGKERVNSLLKATLRGVGFDSQLSVLLCNGTETAAPDREQIHDVAAFDAIFLSDFSSDENSAAQGAAACLNQMHDATLLIIDGCHLMSHLAWPTEIGNHANLDVIKAGAKSSIPFGHDDDGGKKKKAFF